jgi:hypothetical protein
MFQKAERALVKAIRQAPKNAIVAAQAGVPFLTESDFIAAAAIEFSETFAGADARIVSDIIAKHCTRDANGDWHRS